MPRRSRSCVSAVEPSLVAKVIAVDEALSAVDIAHAFGGALALAYYTSAPRATADIDVNVSVDAADAERVFAALPDGVDWSDHDVARVHSDEQVRLWWGRTPVDLFFRASEFHDAVAQRVERHAFGPRRLPFLAARDLAVFKSLFDRPKDWVDIAAMHDTDAFDLDVAADTLRALVGDDPRVERMLSLRGGH